ncbi:MAG: sugar-binding domain-containing protein, partial [Aristaeellaceae bacterium]
METDRIPLMDGWRFCLTEDGNAALPGFDDSAWQEVDLPHDWQIEQPRRQDAPGGAAQGFFPREQRGVYRLRFHAPEAWADKQVRVLFDGVQRFSSVFLNGQPVGGRPYGYVPLLCDLTDALRPGTDNLLAVIADNRVPEGSAWQHAGGDRWYSGAGIVRQVWLLVDEPVHLMHDGVRIAAQLVFPGPGSDLPCAEGISCQEASVQIAAKVAGPCEGHHVSAALYAPDGSLLCQATQPAQALTLLSMTIPRPALWSPDTPVRYRALVALDDTDA